MSLGKKILLINNVVWNETYPDQHPLKNVLAWYQTALKPLGKFRLRTIFPESAELPKRLKLADAIIVSGAPRNAWSNDYTTLRLMRLLEEYVLKEKPILGICYGHQLLARALGSEVKPNPLGWEIGQTTLTLTSQGKLSALFRNYPESFSVTQSHRDMIVQLPRGGTLLAQGKQTYHQAFQVGKTTFGVQFHPEMNRDILNFLWAPRLAQLESGLARDIRDKINQTPQTLPNSDIIANFIRNYA